MTIAAIGGLASAVSASAGTISAISAVAGLAGTAISAFGQMQQGKAAQQNANYQAAQMEQQATQAKASSQRQAMEHQRQTSLVQSTLQARAAASGGGADDDTVVKLGSDIAGRGEEQALMDLYNGENTARGLDDSAAAKRVSGQAAQQGAQLSAYGTIASGIGQGFERFSRTNPFALPSAAPKAG